MRIPSLANLVALVIAVTAGTHPLGVWTATAGCPAGGRMFEIRCPEAVVAMRPSDHGFTSQYWEWGRGFYSSGGPAPVTVEETASGFAVIDLNWAMAESCEQSSTTPRTIVVFEATGLEGGRYAVINLADNDLHDVDIDRAQESLAGAQSRAGEIPRPTLDSIGLVEGFYRVALTWRSLNGPEALSDLVDEAGRPTPSVTSYSVWVGAGGARGGSLDSWKRVHDTTAGSINGYSIDTAAVVQLPSPAFQGATVRFALGMVFDGKGDPNDGSGSFGTRYVSAPSAGVRLVKAGKQPFVRDLSLYSRLGYLLGGELGVVDERQGTSYRVFATIGERQVLLTTFRGTGAQRYQFQVRVEDWVLSGDAIIRVEMVSAPGAPVSWIEDGRIEPLE